MLAKKFPLVIQSVLLTFVVPSESYYKIVQATDGSTGGSDVDEDFGETGETEAERNDD